MRDFIIYLASRSDYESATKTKELVVEKLKTWPGTYSITELNIVPRGKLRFISEYPSYIAFQFFGKYYPRISRVAKERPLIPIEFALWKVKESPLVIVFDAPRKVARVAIALMSMFLYNDPFVILPISIGLKDFLKLRQLIKEKSGNLTRLHLKGVKGSGGVARKFEVTGLNLEQFFNVAEALRSASRIHSLGFMINPPTVQRTISFRITEWGGGQIYAPPDPQDPEILWLLDLFRQALFPDS